MQEYLLIGTVLKPQGVRGECKIKSYASQIGLFAEWKTLYLEDRGVYSPVSSRVVRIRDGFVYAVLDGCASAGDAEKLRGRDLYIDRARAARPEEKDADLIADLVGCRAVDENGREIGVLEDVLQHGPVDTWLFRTPEGTLMVPALLAVFPRVDVASGRIDVLSDKLQEVAVLDR